MREALHGMRALHGTVGAPAGRRAHALYALNPALRTGHGHPHSCNAIESWMDASGLALQRIISLSDATPSCQAPVARTRDEVTR